MLFARMRMLAAFSSGDSWEAAPECASALACVGAMIMMTAPSAQDVLPETCRCGAAWSNRLRFLVCTRRPRLPRGLRVSDRDWVTRCRQAAHIDMFSGNTIWATARIMIIDPPKRHWGQLGGIGGRPPMRSPTRNAGQHAHSGEQLTSLLVFRAGSAQPKAVRLPLVTRLEEIAADKIELSNGRYMVQYPDQ